MSLTHIIEEPMKTMTLFLVVCASKNMEGSKIAAVNKKIEELIPAIKEVSDSYSDARIEIAALTFSSGARWVTANGPVPAEQFRWVNLKAEGDADFGAACKALNEKLSRNEFMQKTTGYFAPWIFLFFDGEPAGGWQSELALLKQNNWFKAAVKTAVGNVENRVLKEFTGTLKMIFDFETMNSTFLKKLIQFVNIEPNFGKAADSSEKKDIW